MKQKQTNKQDVILTLAFIWNVTIIKVFPYIILLFLG